MSLSDMFLIGTVVLVVIGLIVFFILLGVCDDPFDYTPVIGGVIILILAIISAIISMLVTETEGTVTLIKNQKVIYGKYLSVANYETIEKVVYQPNVDYFNDGVLTLSDKTVAEEIAKEIENLKAGYEVTNENELLYSVESAPVTVQIEETKEFIKEGSVTKITEDYVFFENEDKISLNEIDIVLYDENTDYLSYDEVTENYILKISDKEKAKALAKYVTK